MQVKVARYKKHLCIILNIQQNLKFPARTENQAFVLVFVRKKIELHNTKLTPSDSKTEKASSYRGKHSVTGKENSNFAVS